MPSLISKSCCHYFFILPILTKFVKQSFTIYLYSAENGVVLPRTHAPATVESGNPEMSVEDDDSSELAAASVMLMHQIRLGDQNTSWRVDPQHVSSSGKVWASTIALKVRPLDDAYILRITALTHSAIDIEINDVSQYVIKINIWHELTMLDSRQMALYLSGPCLSRFCTVLTSTLSLLGKYDRLTPSRDFFNPDDLIKQQKIMMMRSLQLQELQKQPLQQQQQQSVHQRKKPQHALEPEHTNSEELYERLQPTKPESTDLPRARTANRSKPLPPIPVTQRKLPVDPQSRHRPPQSEGSRDQRVPSKSTDKTKWKCVRCAMDNMGDSLQCVLCSFNRQTEWACPKRSRCTRGVNPSCLLRCPSCSAWKCRHCTAINSRASATCIQCRRS